MASSSYPLHEEDWRGRFIYDMAAALGKQSSTQLSLWAPSGPLPPGVSSALLPGDAEWLANLLAQGGIAHLLRTRKMTGFIRGVGLLLRLRRAIRKTPTDVAHINWLQNALALWGTSTPAVITVLGSDFRLLALPGMRQALRHVLKQRRAVLAPNTEWMAPELNRTFGDVADIRPVPFGVEAGWFDVQRLPLDNVKKWLVVSRLTSAKLGKLFEWGDGLFNPNSSLENSTGLPLCKKGIEGDLAGPELAATVKSPLAPLLQRGEYLNLSSDGLSGFNGENELHLFGPMQEQISLPAWVHYHGSTHPAALRELWFPSAAGLITLSCHDEGRPQVMLEAMAAGLPVIASDLPAHRDLIHHKETGWLATSQSAFSDAITTLGDASQNDQLGEAGRKFVKERIGTWEDCAKRYQALYTEIMEVTYE